MEVTEKRKDRKKQKRQRKYTFKQMMSSITGRILIVIITLVVPINIISLGLLANNFYNSRMRVKQAVNSSLELVASNILSDVSNMKKSMVYESIDNDKFTALMDREIVDRSKKYETINEVSSTLKRIQLVQNQVHFVFFYFPKNDIYITYGAPGIDQNKLLVLMNEYIEQNDKSRSIWSIVKINDIPYLINSEKQRNYNYGILLQLNLTSAKLTLDKSNKSREVFLGNEDGSIVSNDGVAYLKSINSDIKTIENSRKYFLGKVPVGDTSLYIYEIVPYSEIDSAVGTATRIIMILLSVFIIVAIPILMMQMRRLIINPLDKLDDAMDIIESGETDYRIQNEAVGEFKHINESFNAMLDQLEDLKIDIYEHEIEERNIRLEYLSQQVQPHFILNALNILYSYDPEEYELAQKMIMCISKYFRHIVYANDKFVSLKSEMDHISNYFEIQKARFPDLFYSIVEYDESLDETLIPPLVLQTFVENAIKSSLKIGNRITIFVIGDKYEEDGRKYVRVRIADTGEGIPDQILDEIKAFEESGIRQEHLGVGIQNTIERFKVIYNGGAKLSFSRDEHYPGTNVEILLPLHFRGEHPIVEEFT